MDSSPMASRLAFFLLPMLIGCGSGARSVCPSERHAADPDGRGERCIDDRSACDSPTDCVTDDRCCTAECVDGGDGVYGCQTTCREPDCTEVSCGPGMRCQVGPDECSAACVPEGFECPPGTFPADPRGTGTFECIGEDSTCLSAAECPASACCTASCADAGDGRYECRQDCGGFGGGDGDSDADADCGCLDDAECAKFYGPGSVCCNCSCTAPPAECADVRDCAIVMDLRECCPCPIVVPRSELSECIVEAGTGDGDPAGCALKACDDVKCVTCEEVGADCAQGYCIAVPANPE